MQNRVLGKELVGFSDTLAKSLKSWAEKYIIL